MSILCKRFFEQKEKRTCIKFGIIVSFIKTVKAPATPRSSAVTGSPDLEEPITMAPFKDISQWFG